MQDYFERLGDMVVRYEDLIGRRFGKLTVISKAESGKKGKTRWTCKCDCGNIKDVAAGDLKSGDTTSCGCKRKDGTNRRKDLTGKKFGKLTVVCMDEEKTRKGVTYWKCKCECGNDTSVSGTSLRENGGTKSCGCLLGYERNKNRVMHKQSNTRLYREWFGMKRRCSPKSNEAKDYYDRGIIVCEEWKNDFLNFAEWAMANGYNDNLTIDRIDVNGNYEPSNCRWATHTQQQNNKRNNLYIEYNSETHTASEWGRIVGIRGNTIAQRIKYGWNAEKALFTPVKKKSK